MTWNHALTQTQIIAIAHAAEPSMDSDAFAAFYERSARSLWAYLSRCSGDPALAEDIMQESYVRFLGANQPDGEVNARRYLFRIATNLLHDHWRRPRTSSLEDVHENFFASVNDENNITAQIHLDRAMSQLRPRERQLLWLAHAENYSHQEIAEITGLASTSIRLLLFRARQKIKQLMAVQAPIDRTQ